MPYQSYSLTATNLKCIGSEAQGFERIAWTNVIVGRNNSGKSSLIDLVEAAVTGKVKFESDQRHRGNEPCIFVDGPISEEDVRVCFPHSTSGGPIRGNHFEYGRQFIGAHVSTKLVGNGRLDFVKIHKPDSPAQSFVDEVSVVGEYLGRLSNLPNRNPFSSKEFRRLTAERDILPENDGSNVLGIAPNGAGTTNAIQQFLNKASLPRDLVKVTLLAALNEVFNPDTIFTEIVCRQVADGRWEIFLNEKAKGLIPLSQSGSGIKTVILALCFIHLSPAISGKPLGQFVMAFEELENNLHPALQRRLLGYLARIAAQHSFPIFLTTHSSIAIDLFNRDPAAQIVHVTHNGQHSTCRTVKAYIERCGILDDLDIRASDLLQANGIIWVEGPSDRVYLNRWIDLWTDGELKEGNHYQCVFYGGRLLSHISGDDPDNEQDGVPILRVNRNAFVVIDGDKRSESDLINATKQRVIDEITGIGGNAWVTDGREIENYIPFEALRSWYSGPAALATPPERFQSVFDYFDDIESGLGTRYGRKKAVLAEAIVAHTSKEQLAADLALASHLTRLCASIKNWNRLPEPTPPSEQ